MSAHAISFAGLNFTAEESESLLDAGLRAGMDLPFSCRGGICQACLLRCTDGVVPAHAQRTLSPSLQAKAYLLACQCQASGPMSLALPDPADRLTSCLLHDSRQENDYLFLRFATARQLPCKAGQTLLLDLGEIPPLILEITAVHAEAFSIEALLHCPPETMLPDWLRHSEFGHAFDLAGPLEKNAGSDSDGRSLPEADPLLWTELEDGKKIRAILEDFYRQVYEDSRLAPFFTGSTMGRAIDKQYSFLRQLMTGEACYFGDRPRNAHHWMVISDEIYDYRQDLMQRTQLAHGLSDCQIARWSRLENHFRNDMVKDSPWPRRIGGMAIPFEGFAEETLSVGSVCDYCQQIVEPGTTVRYHLRLGKISCPACSQASPAPGSTG